MLLAVRIVIAPDSFKGSLAADQAAARSPPPARPPGPRHVHDAHAAVALQHPGVAGQRGVEEPTSSGPAPFCGPNRSGTRRPGQRVVDVGATTRSTAGQSRVQPGRRPAGPSAPALPRRVSSLPPASSSRTPSACSVPAPPSVVALPPDAEQIRRAPASSAARTSSPTPRVVAVQRRGLLDAGRARRGGGSTTARRPSRATSRRPGRPSGPPTRTGRRRAGAAERAATRALRRRLPARPQDRLRVGRARFDPAAIARVPAWSRRGCP